MTPMTRASDSAGVGDAADGVFVGPEVAGYGLVDDDDGLLGVDVFPGHVAALDEAHADGVEVAGGDDVDEGSGELAGLIVLALGGDAPGAVAGHGERVGDGGGLDAGDLLDAVEDLAVEGGVLAAVFDVPLGIVEEDGGGAGGLEAEVDIEDAEEAAEEKAGADEEDAGEGDLRDDEGGAEGGGGLASGGAGCRSP